MSTTVGAVAAPDGEEAETPEATPWPGLAVALAGGLAALALNAVLPVVSALLIAIVLGLVAGNLVGPRRALAPGLSIASRRVLRVGIALLGLQLALREVLALGWGALAVVFLVVCGGIGLTLWTGRLIGVPPARRLLIACGTSICGAAAVAAVDGVSESDEEDVAVALSMVVALGSVAMVVLPLLSGQLGLTDRAAGAWAGGGIHEVGQVVVAGGILGTTALQVAIVVKLARVLMLAPVLVVVSWRRRATEVAPGRRTPLVPGFVVVFVALVLVGSLTSVPPGVRDVVALVQGVALATAMCALGFAVDIRALRRLRPTDLMLGVASSLVVASLALALVLLVA